MSAREKPRVGSPLFTVQQIELIRRLRNSGLTKEQVVTAFESFDQVDAELGNVYTVPLCKARQNGVVTTPLVPGLEGRMSNSHATLPLTQQAVFPEISQHSANQFSVPSMHLTPPVSVPSTNSQPTTSLPLSTLQCSSAEAEAAAAAVPVNRRLAVIHPTAAVKAEWEDSVEAGGGGSPEVKMERQDSGEEGGGATSVSTSALTHDVNSFFKKGTGKMYEEIREFLFAHPALIQSNIADAAGVAVTSVNKFLIGNFPAIPPLELYLLCQWFLSTRRHHQQHSLNGGETAVPMETFLNMSHGNAGGMAPGDPDCVLVTLAPRRERFTFRTQHLEVLEAYFKTKQYPKHEECCDIALRCNDAVEKAFGRPVGGKERMSPQNVSYWFSNRRKDIKRMAREGGVETSSVVLPSKVRPVFSTPDTDTAVVSAASSTPTTPLTSQFSLHHGGVEASVPSIPQNPETAASLQSGVSDAVGAGEPVLDAIIEAADLSSLVGVSHAVTKGSGSVTDRSASASCSPLVWTSGDAHTPPAAGL